MGREIEKTEGVILGSQGYGEGDRIITVFTPDFGLIKLFAKGASRPRSKHGAATTPLVRAEFLYTRGRSDLYRLLEGSVVDPFLHLRDSLTALETAGHLIQDILASQWPGKAAPLLYSLVIHYLTHLSSVPPESLLASFRLKILCHEGLLAVTETRLDADFPLPLTPTDMALAYQLASTRSFTRLAAIPVSESLARSISTLFAQMPML